MAGDEGEKDGRAGMSAVEIHISGTAERLDLVNMQAERIEKLETLLAKYIVHVGDAEGTDFIDDGYRGSLPDLFTDDEFETLRAFADVTWDEYNAAQEDDGQEELGL